MRDVVISYFGDTYLRRLNEEDLTRLFYVGNIVVFMTSLVSYDFLYVKCTF